MRGDYEASGALFATTFYVAWEAGIQDNYLFDRVPAFAGTDGAAIPIARRVATTWSPLTLKTAVTPSMSECLRHERRQEETFRRVQTLNKTGGYAVPSGT